MKTRLISSAICASIVTANAAWVWLPPEGTAANTDALLSEGVSGSFSLTPQGADYDINNSIASRGFDIAPTPVSFSYTSGSEQIRISLNNSGNGNPPRDANESFIFDLDPDNNGIIPTSITFSVRYSTAISDRGLQFGGLGAGLNAVGNTLDYSVTTFDANLQQIGLLATDLFTGGTPTITSDGSAFFDNANVGNGGSRQGLRNVRRDDQGVPTETTRFGFEQQPGDLSIGGQDLVLSDFANNGEFRLTFDGGVGENALTVVPEPSTALLGSLALFGLLSRRNRN